MREFVVSANDFLTAMPAKRWTVQRTCRGVVFVNVFGIVGGPVRKRDGRIINNIAGTSVHASHNEIHFSL